MITLFSLVGRTRFELVTNGLKARYSIPAQALFPMENVAHGVPEVPETLRGWRKASCTFSAEVGKNTPVYLHMGIITACQRARPTETIASRALAHAFQPPFGGGGSSTGNAAARAFLRFSVRARIGTANGPCRGRTQDSDGALSPGAAAFRRDRRKPASRPIPRLAHDTGAGQLNATLRRVVGPIVDSDPQTGLAKGIPIGSLGALYRPSENEPSLLLPSPYEGRPPVNLITIRSQIESVSARWDDQYPPKRERDEEKLKIGRLLRGLDTKHATPELVAAIIGNKSWAGPTRCHECNGSFDAVVQVGEPDDYDSHTVTLCCGCAAKAASLFAALTPKEAP